MGLVTLPEATRIWRRSPRHLPVFCAAVSLGLALAALSWGVILLLALPRGLGHLMLGSLWRPTYPLVLPFTVSVIGGCLISGAGTALHALGAAKRSLRAMIWSSALNVGGAVTGAVVDGAIGTVIGMAIGNWLGVVGYWWQLRVALREADGAPADRRYWPDPPAGRHSTKLLPPGSEES
jgi:O-antigen/teichoic acid export membrane protein